MTTPSLSALAASDAPVDSPARAAFREWYCYFAEFDGWGRTTQDERNEWAEVALAVLSAAQPPDAAKGDALKITLTNRGFGRAEFTDLYGHKASIQESSLATDDALWLGCESGTHVDGQCCARMHLNCDGVRALMPLLHHFIEHGRLPRPPAEVEGKVEGT